MYIPHSGIWCIIVWFVPVCTAKILRIFSGLNIKKFAEILLSLVSKSKTREYKPATAYILNVLCQLKKKENGIKQSKCEKFIILAI